MQKAKDWLKKHNNKLYTHSIALRKAKEVVIKVSEASSASRSSGESMDFDSEPSV